jgi:hypothetical protein
VSETSGEESVDRMLEVLASMIALLGSTTENVTALDERLGELAESVAGLGLRVRSLELTHETAGRLRILPPLEDERIEELAAKLRAELAVEVEAITARIDRVHERALRALTDLTERKSHA